MPTTTANMEKIVSLCKRRGFVFPASEIYGGLNGFWDYGPLGVELKNNLRDAWWNDMVRHTPAGPEGETLTIVGVDSAIIQNPRVWEASGHVAGFNDPMVDDKETKSRYRADHLTIFAIVGNEAGERIGPYFAAVADFVNASDEELIDAHKKTIKQIIRKGNLDHSGYVIKRIANGINDGAIRSETIGPGAKQRGSLTEPRQFNLMFKTYVGAASGEDNVAFLRPETAQGIFTNYKNVLDTMRVKVPFGIAQIGKSFRNEVTPRNYVFRSREFEQMEMEWFCHPDEARKWYEFWVDARLAWWTSLGIHSGNLQRREHDDDELAHYSTACADVEYRYPFTDPGYGELEGIAHRGCYDLTQHQQCAKTKLEYFDHERNERYLPHVIEPAAGLTRGLLVLLCEAYTFDESRASKEFMRFHPRLAPLKAAVFPLVAKDGMPEIAEPIYREIRKHFPAQYDVKQAIGKRYARMDEAGTPFCFTVDGQTKDDGTVTVRDRDDASQVRIDKSRCLEYLREKLAL